jgi:hypothetical protein
MTIPGGYIAGDVLTAANMNLLPGGKMGYASITSPQGSITGSATDITSLTVTWTAVSSRLYRTSFVTLASSTVATDVALVLITDGSGTQKTTTSTYLDSTSSFMVSSFLLETGLSGSVTRKLRALRTGSGTLTIQAATDYPAFILVEDIGPA